MIEMIVAVCILTLVIGQMGAEIGAWWERQRFLGAARRGDPVPVGDEVLWVRTDEDDAMLHDSRCELIERNAALANQVSNLVEQKRQLEETPQTRNYFNTNTLSRSMH